MKNESFTKRLMELQGNILKVAYSLTSDKNLLQDTTLKAFDDQNKDVDNVNFKEWVSTIIRNVFMRNYCKMAISQSVVSLSDELYELYFPQYLGLKTLDNERLKNVLMDFPDDYRVPFFMHISGFKCHEIAENMDLSIGTVKSRIFFIHKKLQEINNK